MSFNIPMIAGFLLIAFGYGQFLFFFGLDALGLIEVGNGLGHGLILWFSQAAGSLCFLLGFAVATVKAAVRRRHQSVRGDG